MTRITINDVKDSLSLSNSYDIMNAIRNSASDTFQQYVPLANANNIAEVGAGITISQTVQNEFVTSLVDRISLVILRNVSLNNPLKKFKKGQLPLGRTIEEIFVDISQEKMYDPRGAEETVFKREIPDVKTLFHEVNRKGYYKQTIQDSSLKQAFVSWGDFDRFLSGVINSMYNSAEVDEYEYMKLLIDNYAAKGHFKSVGVELGATPTEATLKNLVKRLRATAKLMTMPQGSREYNSLGVRTTTDMRNLHLFITAELEAEMDVEVLASAFNMSRTDFLGNVTVIDNFATPGLKAVLVDSDFFMVYDTNQKMESIRNPQGLYWNYFYHVWQLLSTSRFSNAVAFYDTSEASLNAVTEIVLSPSIASVRQGDSLEINAIVSRPSNVTITDAGTLNWAMMVGDDVLQISESTAAGSKLTPDANDPTKAVLSVSSTETKQIIVIYEWSGTTPEGGGTAPSVDGRAVVNVELPIK